MHKIVYNVMFSDIIIQGDFMNTITINIAGQDIEFTENTCKCYDDILNTIVNQATTDTIKQMNAMPEAEFISLIAGLWTKLEQEFNMNTELTQSLKK
jgi:hypothetical protein